jgi:hypothetical protein
MSGQELYLLPNVIWWTTMPRALNIKAMKANCWTIYYHFAIQQTSMSWILQTQKYSKSITEEIIALVPFFLAYRRGHLPFLNACYIGRCAGRWELEKDEDALRATHRWNNSAESSYVKILEPKKNILMDEKNSQWTVVSLSVHLSQKMKLLYSRKLSINW